MSQRTIPQMIDWYRSHEVWPEELDYNPDGMCLKICRDARNIDPMWPSALSAQHATPAKHRIHKIESIRKGNIGFFDDPNDSNPFGHIVTWVGRRRNVDPTTLESLLARTNSVKSNHIVVVDGGFFLREWGDRHQFSSDYLNGEELLMRIPKPPAALPPKGIEKLERIIRMYARMIDNNREDPRIARALKRDKREILQTLKDMS